MAQEKDITFEEKTELRFNHMDREIIQLERRILNLEVKPNYRSGPGLAQIAQPAIPHRDKEGNIKR